MKKEDNLWNSQRIERKQWKWL